MLVLRRKSGQWIEITHGKSGDVLRVKVYDILRSAAGQTGQCNLAFDDDERNFVIQRPEWTPLAENPSLQAEMNP